MKHTPVLDARDARALMEEIAGRARSYTPEWRFDPEDIDAGGALAAIFSRMFAQTLDRYNGVLHRDYIEFLNLLSVRRQPVTPAQGYVAVEIAPGADQPVELKRDTLFYHDGADGARINYLSDEAIFATPARITGLITVDPAHDAIALREEDEEPFDLFHVPQEKNLQRHRFTLRHDEALHVSRPCAVRVRVTCGAQYVAQETAKRLCRADFARWEYYSQGDWRAFDRVRQDMQDIVLEKDGDLPLEECPAQEGEAAGRRIRCTMTRTQDNTAISVQALHVDSVYREGESVTADAAYANDVRVDLENGGYCFSAPMLIYDAFYIASDEVFCKRGATVTLRLNLHTLVRKADQEQPRYEFRDKFVIDKEQTPPEPQKTFISRVVWEYWNGVGWTHLSVTGDLNPFGEEAEGEKRVVFALPEDIQRTYVSSVEHYWVRARAVEVANPFDPYATRLLPFVQGMRLTYRYPALRAAQELIAENNLERTVFAGVPGQDLSATLYAPLPDERPALYLCFDDAPAGYPVNLYLEMQGRVRERRHVRAEAFLGRAFEEVKTTDTLEGCTRGGVLSLYLPPLLKRTAVFGREGWFVRLVDATGRAEPESWPRLRRLILNCAHVTQRERAADMSFSTGIHEADKRLRLDEGPVLEAEVWVDERGSLSGQALDAMLAQPEERRRAEYAADGSLARLFVKWDRTDALALCGGEDRVWELDAQEGRITFGDGVHGAIPPAGDDNIRVSYSFGGGSQGNIDVDGIAGIATPQASVTRAYNFLPICGGNDLQSMELVERLGPQRLRHRGRAVTRQDFEALVLEEFSEVRAVRCFPNTDDTGAPRSGCVTVVVLTGSYENESYALAVCERIEKYLKERCDGALARSGLSVRPAQVMTVGVTAKIEVDAPENAAEAERGALQQLDRLMDPMGEREGGVIGALPTPADLYAALRRAPHVLAVRDVLMEGAYFDYTTSCVVALDQNSAYPFAVPRSGRHRIYI